MRGSRRSLALALGVLLACLEALASNGEQILAAVRQELHVQRALYREPGMLDVSLKRLSGAAVLVGSVPSEAARTQAEVITRSVLPEAEIRNRLRVEVHEVLDPMALRDLVLMSKIEAALQGEPGLAQARRHVHVEVNDRNATLRGEIDGPLMASELIETIRRIAGLSTLNLDQLRF